MTTWIGHLRIAEQLLVENPALDEVAFTLGNLGPDSGKPNADWSEFDPPKHVTHFLREGDGEDRIHDLDFYRDYLLKVSPNENSVYSYYLGYFVHLLCDNLWTRWVWQASKVQFAGELAEKGNGFVWELKRDWYDLDHKYVRDHENCLFWRVLIPTPNPATVLPFIPEHAMRHSLNHIRAFTVSLIQRMCLIAPIRSSMNARCHAILMIQLPLYSKSKGD
ncbi:MAG: hypothetical protein KF726_14840 [Anaerolineae bacterium]|nr:hypothetical protein [Anaerolineae bacterium]